MLLPALGQAREKMKDVTCTANLRTIHQGFMLYAGNFKDTLPQMATNSTDPNLNSYIVTIWPYLYPSSPFKSGDANFATYIKNSIFHCPFNPCYEDTQAGFASFAANMHLSLTNLDQIESPTQKILAADGGSDQYDGIYWGNVVFIYTAQANYPLNITYRHNDQANVVHVDGRVSKILIYERYGLYPSGRILPKDMN